MATGRSKAKAYPIAVHIHYRGNSTVPRSSPLYGRRGNGADRQEKTKSLQTPMCQPSPNKIKEKRRGKLRMRLSLLFTLLADCHSIATPYPCCQRAAFCWSYVPTTPFRSEHRALRMSRVHIIPAMERLISNISCLGSILFRPAIERLISKIHVSRPSY